jgi:hypothetical protein
MYSRAISFFVESDCRAYDRCSLERETIKHGLESKCKFHLRISQAGQADRIDAELDEISRRSPPPFQDVVERILDKSINPQHPRGSYIAKWWGES